MRTYRAVLLAAVATPAFAQADPRAELEALMQSGHGRTPSAVDRAPLRTGIDPGGNRIVFSDGSVLEKVAEGLRLSRPSTGEWIAGASSRTSFDNLVSLDQVGWIGAPRVGVVTPRPGLPAGEYLVRGLALTGWYPLRAPVVSFEPGADVLAKAGPRPAGCPEPTARPAGWVSWWGGCASPDKHGAVTVMSFAPDRAMMVRERFRHGRSLGLTLRPYRLERQGLEDTLYEGAALATTGDIGILGEGRKLVRGRVEYRGRFDGLVPAGDGRCAKPVEEGGGEEDCRYVGGVRTDRNQIDRLARIERERQEALARAEQERLRIAEENRLAALEAQRRANQPSNGALIFGAIMQGIAQGFRAATPPPPPRYYPPVPRPPASGGGGAGPGSRGSGISGVANGGAGRAGGSSSGSSGSAVLAGGGSGSREPNAFVGGTVRDGRGSAAGASTGGSGSGGGGRSGFYLTARPVFVEEPRPRVPDVPKFVPTPRPVMPNRPLPPCLGPTACAVGEGAPVDPAFQAEMAAYQRALQAADAADRQQRANIDAARKANDEVINAWSRRQAERRAACDADQPSRCTP